MTMDSLFSILVLWLGLENVTASNTLDQFTRNANVPWSLVACENNIWDADAGGYSCGDRISYLIDVSKFQPSKACRTVAAEFPEICGLCSCDDEEDETTISNTNQGMTNSNTNYRCGCEYCEKYAWQVYADGYTCGDRINYLLSLPFLYPNEEAACRQVAQVEFPSQCGLCRPDRCDGTAPPPLEAPPPPLLGAPPLQGTPSQSHEPPTDLYCFPPDRTRFYEAWGKYTLEVKEGDSCGPSDNLFSRRGVSMSKDKKELKLQLGRQNDGRWYSSEVRLLLPTSEYYDYGRYLFSLKSIQVFDTVTDGLVSNTLPPSVILGLFTWDDTKNFAIREDYNQEVDIEISRWNIRDNADVQFLVQPPGNPQEHRFYSGAPPTISLPVYDQAPHIYEFDWEPAEISWSSSAGGGQSFTYGTQDALNAGQPDYTQCMPANVEVRINLWNLLGSFQAPTDMKDDHVVEVVIDMFDYQPSGRKAVPEGGVCSKNCHCGDLQCVGNRCSSRADTIAAANKGEEQSETSIGFWQHSRWVILGALLSLVLLLALINYFYYRHHRHKPVSVVHDPFDKDMVGTDDEEAGSASSSSSCTGPFAANMGGEEVETHGALASTPGQDPLKVVTVEDRVELFQPDPLTIATMPAGVEEAESCSSEEDTLQIVKGENDVELFHYGDWMDKLKSEAAERRS